MKFSKFKTKATALVLTLALCLSSLITAPSKSEAATEYITILQSETSETASAGETKKYNFSVQENTATYIDITVAYPTDTFFSLAAGNDTYDRTISASSWKYDAQYDEYYYTVGYTQLSTTYDYTLSLTFSTNNIYLLNIFQEKPVLTMNSSSIVITKGFTSKISVSNASGTVTWSSSNKSIASVDKNGKVTAKATGSATITATDTSGAKATCKVTVKKNEYNDSKLKTSDVSYGSVSMGVHNISYDKKGNLVIKANCLNNSSRKVTQFKNIKITVKTSKSGKTIGTYTLKSKNVSINPGGSKSFTFTIAKSKLKIKSTKDLRGAYPTISGKYYS